MKRRQSGGIVRLTLDRYASTKGYTMGLLFLDGDFLCHMLERPWLNNHPWTAAEPDRASCIPTGAYTLRKWIRPNGNDVFIIDGGTVCHLERELSKDTTRFLILWHTANTPNEIAGCAAPGLGAFKGSVSQSRSAMTLLHTKLNPYFSMQPYLPLVISDYQQGLT
jgi:hypothetical protein